LIKGTSQDLALDLFLNFLELGFALDVRILGALDKPMKGNQVFDALHALVLLL